MNYEIIRDIEKLNAFLDLLPKNTDDERYLLFLFARKKYHPLPGLTADKCQLKRILCHKKEIVSELSKLEVKQGLYKFDDLIIPQENLVVYIQPNPRSLKKAMRISLQEGMDHLLDGGNLNLKSIFYNNCQKHVSKKYFYTLDVDFNRPLDRNIVVEEIKKLVGDVGIYLATRNGIHGLLELDKLDAEFKNTWFKNLSSKKWDGFEITMNADNPCVIPGCIQSIHTPYIIS
jgi:hypothetical protein